MNRPSKGIDIIKAFQLNADNADTITAPYEGLCRYYLFDTPCAAYGGSGKTFDWALTQSYHGNTPFLLSGGIRPESLEHILSFCHPSFAGIDIKRHRSHRQIHKTIKDTIKTDTTMDRINELFSNKRHDILSIYFCAGAPKADNTAEVITFLEKNGVDMIEIGIPFSDPLADGPVIQDASCQALRNGMTLTGLFAQLEGIRSTVSIPLVLMGYLNPIMQYGMEQFFRSCSSTGIDGAIIPGLSMSTCNQLSQ